ncbi:efflux RND transporter periplasmic adaptor subunit [Rhizosaccharibacter radicis]|uniref:Efflux RND transporter periplasmic adaptor subunit n=1 Tax=Rhizosaccharibacter radicis TaxID=2782605 RepID=A0ABT1VYK0_9PROT|nr:efflux RND transporter periplasmic adaptor subunit [Acetobacteraceae bacterium KSS12]
MAVLTAIVLGTAAVGLLHRGGSSMAAPPPMPPGAVTVSTPLARPISPQLGFLGQFSAVDAVEIRAQVGGLLTEIHFTDGQIVHKGDLLFVIDPRPYQIKLEQAAAQLQTAQSRLKLSGSELWRAQQLKSADFGTGQAVDQRSADQRTAIASMNAAQAAIRDAQLDLEYTHVVAPFTGRISAHRVSVGALVSGSRGGSNTTLLTTLVSLDPIYLDFDMSENDFLAYQRGRGTDDKTAPDVAINVGDHGGYDRHGKLDFIDNALDRSSGTLHARATVPNPDLTLLPGEFARLRLTVSQPSTALLVPAAAVVPDQSQHLLMTVSADNKVVPKPVEIGGLRGGLRVVKSGLAPTDRVIIDGLMHAMPGAPVAPSNGAIHFDPSIEAQD